MEDRLSDQRHRAAAGCRTSHRRLWLGPSGHRRIDELKKVLIDVNDIEFSDTTYVKRAMKLLGQF